ncbi:hypothetical protein, partial [Rhodothermus profundi]|uniref:hypothetical protein n=1 Tax=Rhodothermus profundi TaxID=633813 RepID=UPI001C49F0A5
VFSNRYVLRITLVFILIAGIYGMLNGLLYEDRRDIMHILIRPLYTARIVSFFISFELLIIAALTKKIDLALNSNKDVLFWSTITTYYFWSILFFIIRITHILSADYTIISITLFAIIFIMFFLAFCLVYRIQKRMESAH